MELFLHPRLPAGARHHRCLACVVEYVSKTSSLAASRATHRHRMRQAEIWGTGPLLGLLSWEQVVLQAEGIFHNIG